MAFCYWCQCIFGVLLLYPLRQGCGPSFEQTWILINQRCYVVCVWFKLTQKMTSIYYPYYLPLGKGVAIHLRNLHPHDPRMLWAKFGWNWPSSSAELDFWIFLDDWLNQQKHLRLNYHLQLLQEANRDKSLWFFKWICHSNKMIGFTSGIQTNDLTQHGTIEGRDSSGYFITFILFFICSWLIKTNSFNI